MYNDRGVWLDNNVVEHKFDEPLSLMLNQILKEKNVESIIDFGCGPGEYAWSFTNNGFDCECCDGNPYTKELSKEKCFVKDLSVDFDLEKRYDCVLCLEVGEHIPKEYENILINNLIKHSKNLIILSWATIGQGGHGHVNEAPNEYITQLFFNEGFNRNSEIEKKLRESSQWWWFKNTIMVFEK